MKIRLENHGKGRGKRRYLKGHDVHVGNGGITICTTKDKRMSFTSIEFKVTDEEHGYGGWEYEGKIYGTLSIYPDKGES